MTGSKINSFLTLEYLSSEHENKYFDRKSAQIKPSELASLISAFANADGGTVVIGVSDRSRRLEGINSVGEERINDFINAPKDHCRPMPRYREEFLDIINAEGVPDRLLLLHIQESVDQVIRTYNDKTYLRIGDKTKEMLGDNLRNLEYEKGSRHFEDEPNPSAEIADLDDALLNAYKQRIGAEGIDSHQVLNARGFIRKKDGREYLTNAAVLLFARNIFKFNMNCRVRFIRVDGRELQVGERYNVVKDKSIDEPILRLVEKAKSYISDQLRTFTRQDRESGRFIESPEYPEFTWYEGLINAIAHRDYAASGQFIKVSMYDDRLEIESPGRFPDLVSADNITYTRFSRNKTISRVMTEFEWVRELNEGVKKIFTDMEAAGLPAPEYEETANSVKLILRNNIDVRAAHRNNKDSNKASNESLNESLSVVINEEEKRILLLIEDNPHITQSEIAQKTGFYRTKIQRVLKRLSDNGVIWREGAKKNGTWRIRKEAL